MSTRIDVKALEQLEAAATPGPWVPDGGGGLIIDDDYDAHPIDDAAHGPFLAAMRNACPALLRAARAAARINELVGTETEEGQAEAWEELDAALAPFDFGDTPEDPR